MSGTKVKTLFKNLKTQDETTLETFQELPINFRDVSSTTPAPLDVYVSENKATIMVNRDGDTNSSADEGVFSADSTSRFLLDSDPTAPKAAIKAATEANAAYVSLVAYPNTGAVTSSIGTTGTSGVSSVIVDTSDITITASTSSTGTQTKVFLDGSENKVSVTGALDVSSDVEISGALRPTTLAGISGALDVTSDVEISGALDITGDLAITGSLKSTNASISIGESSQNTISLNSINMNIGSNTTEVINLSSDEVRVTAPLVPTTNELEVKSLTDVGSAVGVTISKPAQGSSYLQLAEYLNGNPYGARLVYEGDSAGEDLQTAENSVALQGITPDSEAGINNILSFHREGTGVRLESQDTLVVTSADLLQLYSADSINAMTTGDITLDADGNLTIDSDNFKIPGQGDIRVPYIPESSNTFVTSNKLVYWTGTGRFYYEDTDSTFSGGHIYRSDSQLPVGTAVELSSNKLQASSTPSSKIVVGIIARQQECTAEAPVKTSLGDELSSGYATKVVALGDTRLMDCQGFNVCNESGDIVPGDLLVTSSTPGYLMKQADDIIRSSTVGKAMEQVTFDENGQATGVYGYLYCG